jgi:hypothetical protein
MQLRPLQDGLPQADLGLGPEFGQLPNSIAGFYPLQSEPAGNEVFHGNPNLTPNRLRFSL